MQMEMENFKTNQGTWQLIHYLLQSNNYQLQLIGKKQK
jgi:hypothetical protein